MRLRLLPTALLTLCILSQPTASRALSQQQALERLGSEVLQPSASLDEIAAYLLPAPLASGTITPVAGSSPSVDVAGISGNPQWFACVDLFPCQYFQHPVKYVFIDDQTGVVTVFDAEDWPALDGYQLADGTAPGTRLIPIFPIVPRPQLVEAPGNLSAPMGDYGDAPEGAPAYPGVTGAFPTLFATVNSVLNRPGAHALVTGVETLGRTVSRETDAGDLSDPDGVPNLEDADSDERMFLAWNPNTSPATAHLIFDVSVAIDAADEDRHVNLLFDFDQNGAWSGAAAGTEWAVKNFVVRVAPGSRATLVSPGFRWGLPERPPTLVWMRAALTPETIDPATFGLPGWDGSGAFASGEIEDAKVYLKGCPGVGCPPPPGGPPGDDDDDGDPPPETPPPGPLFGWNLLPIQYHAIVVQGVDNAGQSAVAQAAGTMKNTLQVQGYNTTSVSGANASKADIANWINGLLPSLTCQDQLLIYFIAHGAKNTPGGSMQLRAKSPGDPGTFTGADLADLLALIPTCSGLDCDFAAASCNVTVIIESCYSGQFLSAVGGSGQMVVTSSTGQEPSWFGADGTGGEYSDQYANCASSSNRGQTDANRDGAVTPDEIHTWAGANLGRPQSPQSSGMFCPCLCPWIWWDCLDDPDGLVRFFPGGVGFNGAPLGQSFSDALEGIVLIPGEPQYDFLKLEGEPNEWVWVAEVPSEGPPIPVEVVVLGAAFADPVRVQLFTLTVPPQQFPPFPLRLIIDLPQNQYVIQDGQNNPIAQGPWDTYPQGLEFQNIAPLPASRANQPPLAPVQVEIVELGLSSTSPMLIHWTPQPGMVYFLENKLTLDAPGWNPVAGPLDNTGRIIVPDQMQGFFQVRAQPMPTGPAN
ncbi:MAG TPA: hypothetical protein DCY13_24030 [Verrucomicrobiales bacterium]|nr:hypothetical protein [Verrucomicrobiales bacterium]